MALRRSGVVVVYAGEHESLIEDWRTVGGDMRKAIKEFDVVGERERAATRA